MNNIHIGDTKMINITINTGLAGLFGDEGVESINVDASVELYHEKLEAALLEEFDNVSVELNSVDDTMNPVACDDDELIPWVDQIVHDVWQEFDWVVYS